MSFLFDRIQVPKIDSSLQDWYRRIMRDLNVERHARDAGRHNKPHSDDVELDVTQQLIVGRFHNGADQLTQALASRIDGATQMITEREPRSFAPSEPAEKVMLEVDALKARSKEALIRTGDREREAWRNREHFKSEHAIVRHAEYPDAPAMAAFLLILLMLVETSINAFVFAAASEHGLLGGWLQALIFSATNVLVGTAAGYLAFRNLNHRRLWRKCLAAIGVMLSLGVAILWNLGVAHYREIVVANSDVLVSQGFVDGGFDVLNRIKIDPLGIHSLPGWALFVLGLLAFGCAAWEGYAGLDDRYPGYGVVDRRLRREERTYADAKNALKNSVADLFVNECRALDRRSLANARCAAEGGEIAKQVRQRVREYRDSAVDLRRACKAALARYREINGQVRDPFAPAPAYFETFPSFEVNLPNPAPLDAAIDRTARALEASVAAIHEARKRLAAAEQQAIAEFDEFFRHVEQEAAKRREVRVTTNHNRQADFVPELLLPSSPT